MEFKEENILEDFFETFLFDTEIEPEEPEENNNLDDGEDIIEVDEEFENIIKSLDSILETGQEVTIDKQDLDHFIESQASPATKESFDELTKQEKIYFQPEKGEKAPEETDIKIGPKGGKYYISEEVTPEVEPKKDKIDFTMRWISDKDKKWGRYRLWITLSNKERNIIEVIAPSLSEALQECRSRSWKVRKAKVLKSTKKEASLDKSLINNNEDNSSSSFQKTNNSEKELESIKKTASELTFIKHGHPQAITILRNQLSKMGYETDVDYAKSEMITNASKETVLNLIPEYAKFAYTVETFQKSEDNEIKLEDIKKAVNEILLKSGEKNVEDLISKTDKFIEKYNEDILVNDFLGGYKQLAMLGKDFPDTKLQKLFLLAEHINIIKSLGRELKSVDRLDMVISIDDCAHQLHIISKKNTPNSLYPILDELAGISKELGEINRDDRLLLLNESPPDIISKFNELEIFQKGNLFEQGRSYWKLLEKAIKFGTEKLTDTECIILREWIFSRI